MLAILLAVDVAVFLLQKAAANSASGETGFLVSVLTRPALWAAIGLAPVQLTLWTRLLARSDLGWAYAITSLAYPLTMLAAFTLFHERYAWQVWLGALLIACGAALIGPSGRHEVVRSGGGAP